MGSLGDAIERRFGDGKSASDVPQDIPLIGAVLSRKTVRRYSDVVPSEDLIDLLVAAALSASAKSDFQQASVLRLMDRPKRDAIAALFPSMPWIGAAPVFLVFLGDAARLETIGRMRGKAVANGTLEGFFNASVDAALIMQTFILCAEAAGLGCCPISVIRNKVDTVAALLELPDKVFPVAGLCVGYPAGEGHVSLRLPRAITVHRDRYDTSRIETEVEAYDRRRDALHSIPKDQHRSVEEFGPAEFYGWSEDKARQAAKPEGAAFPIYLREHGFTLD